MKVVFTPHAYWPSIGGAERYCQGLAEGMAVLGHDIHVVVADVDDPEAFYELGHQTSGQMAQAIDECRSIVFGMSISVIATWAGFLANAAFSPRR